MQAEISMPFGSDNVKLNSIKVQEEGLTSGERVWITFRFQQRQTPHQCFTANLWMDPDTAVELYRALGKSQCVQAVKAKAQRDFEDFVQEGQEYNAFIGAAEHQADAASPNEAEGEWRPSAWYRRTYGG